MQHFYLKDIVDEISVRENNPSSSGYDRFVGLEHYVSGEVEIHDFGSTSNLASAMKVFKSGDILIARRNVYLRRAGVVKFDGLTSGDSIVLRAKNERIAKLLPFIFNTSEFWDYADQNADGTMSKRLSPRILLEYEINLPEPEEQEKLADLLWTAEETRQAYKKLIKQMDELVKSKFKELFGEIGDTNKFPRQQWMAVVDITNGKDHKKISGEGPYGVYGTGGRMLSCKEYMCGPGTIIMGRKGTIDKPYIVPEKCWIVDTAFGVNPIDTNVLNPIYLYFYTI